MKHMILTLIALLGLSATAAANENPLTALRETLNGQDKWSGVNDLGQKCSLHFSWSEDNNLMFFIDTEAKGKTEGNMIHFIESSDLSYEKNAQDGTVEHHVTQVINIVDTETKTVNVIESLVLTTNADGIVAAHASADEIHSDKSASKQWWSTSCSKE